MDVILLQVLCLQKKTISHADADREVNNFTEGAASVPTRKY